MIERNIQASETLAENGKKIAEMATKHFLKNHPDLRDLYGSDSQELWQDHFSDRVADLSESIALGSSKIFSTNLQWANQAMASRDLNTDHLQVALQSLKISIESLIPQSHVEEVLLCLSEATKAFMTDTTLAWESELDPSIPLDRLALHYLQMVIAGNVWASMQLVIDALDDGFSVKDIFLKVLLPAQTEVGRLWHINQLTVAEEHLVSATTERLMAVLAVRANRKSDRGHTAVAASIAGNVHDIGLRAIAYLMECEGWRTIFLGADMPRSELPSAVKYFDADIVLLSVGLTTQLTSLKKTISCIREECGSAVKIMIGGNGLKESPSLWQHIGADGYAGDLEEALIKADNLVT